ncbi:methyltransferase [Alkalibaculum bacchi]|uniref:methyltransferase n=1 Tax=Alkalibaculum bacchi TaxID=645887 RepID=UPI0026EED047|nr:methyltransferase [Alkalibaculum bacchi]
MKFDWNEGTIRRYIEANEYTGFFKNVARIIQPKLEGYSTLCDIGCGLGLLDLELLHNIENITCTDINQVALNALKQTINEKNIQNISTQIMDSNHIQGQWDIILVSFFGAKELESFLPHCKKLIAVVHDDKEGKRFPTKGDTFKKMNVSNVEENLREKSIHYSLTHHAFEFGQPLTSIKEAREYIQGHTPDITPEDLEVFLSEKLKNTGEEKYPFYIPRMKKMGIFEIEGKLFDSI